MSNFKPNKASIIPAAGINAEIAELPIPKLESDEILVEIKAAALNHMDWKRQAFGVLIPSYPVVLGTDIAGVVVDIGSSITAFRLGDRVLGLAHGMMSGKNDNAAFQTYAAIKANLTSPIPENVTFTEAVTVALSTVTATIGLFDTLGVPRPPLIANPEDRPTQPTQKKQKDLITVWGAASSMGQAVVQLARLANLTVLATASPAHHERLLALGASFVVDYRSPTAVQELVSAAKTIAETTGAAPLSLALDAVGTAHTLQATADVLKLAAGEGVRKKLVHLPQLPKGLDIGGEGLEVEQVHGERAFTDAQALATMLYHNALPTWLGNSDIVPSAFKVMEGGLEGLQNALNELKKGGTSEKLVLEL